METKEITIVKDIQDPIKKDQINKKRIKQIIVSLSIVLLLIACNSTRVFDDFYNVDSKGWDKDSVAVFNFEIEDTTVNYDLFISSRNLENYQYSNLWLFINITAPDSTSISDTIEYQMAKPDGKWLGKGTGGVYFIQNFYRTNVFFPDNGNYKIEIQHAMRDEKLEGIKNIGLRVAKR